MCEQQHEVLEKYIPIYPSRLLIGSDNVDRWTEQAIWDAVLNNVRIVVSTHAVLADALTHGFVRMEKLALLVFDEGKTSHSISTRATILSKWQLIIALADIRQTESCRSIIILR